jgi:hypothetical protein
VKCPGDKGLAVLGAEDHVREQVRAGVRHVLSPLRGLGEFYSNSPPTAHAVGYDLSPATRALEFPHFSRGCGLCQSPIGEVEARAATRAAPTTPIFT